MGVKDGIERIDTNILIRLITRDIPEQYQQAKQLIGHEDKLYVFEDAAMMEVVYVLAGDIYCYTRSEIAAGIKQVLDIPNLSCNKSIIESALDVYVSHPKLSFVDCYLAIVAETTQELPLWTFDRKLAAQCPFARLP